MSIQITTKFNHLPTLAERYQAEINAGLEELGEEIQEEGYEATPKVTGAMADSLFHEVSNEGELRVGYQVDYAPDVELGTVHQAAQPALTPAFTNHATEGELSQIAAQAVEHAIGGGEG